MDKTVLETLAKEYRLCRKQYDDCERHRVTAQVVVELWHKARDEAYNQINVLRRVLEEFDYPIPDDQPLSEEERETREWERIGDVEFHHVDIKA